MLFGAILACAVIPPALGVGLVAKTAIDSYEKMPQNLRTPPPAQTSYLYAKDGKTLITAFYEEYRTDVKLPEIAPIMQKAIVASEDSRFYQHGGVDLKGVVRALVANRGSGQVTQGASTLTMQYVRNVLKTDPGLTDEERRLATVETTERKVQEMRYALALERKLSKHEILRRYLNIAYFGAGAYGIEAAAWTYFSKPAKKLTFAEAAMIAGLVQSPEVDNPIDGDQKITMERRSYVLDAMAKMKVITAAQARQAKSQPLNVRQGTQPPNKCVAVAPEHIDWGFFCDYFHQWWRSQPAFGASTALRDYSLKRGGYRIVSSLDPDVQASALRESLAVYPYGNARALPLAVVQPGTGRVLAMAVNRYYSLKPNPDNAPYPNTVNQFVAGDDNLAGYQAGSTFKMFTMLAALDSGLPLSTSFVAPSPLVTHWISGAASCGGHYCPPNANPGWMNGLRTMWDGFGRSVNTYWVWLEEKIGADKAVAMAKKVGIQFRSEADARIADEHPEDWGPFTLGVSQTTPLDLANAYATVAAEGMYCPPLPVLSITTPDGRKLPAGDPSCKRVVSEDVARAATDAARCPIGQQAFYGKCNGGTDDAISGIVGRPVAGKTGTSDGESTESFAGFTPQVAAAATAVNPDNPQDAVGGGVSSSVDQAVAKTMVDAMGGLPVVNFNPPSQAIAMGIT
ncbi:penicillin-binding protein [Planosporangium flavigriseum]|nr:transglycosylase domain-containing protein [Planosporangium flavigriseum]NJC64030.1 penicillin-binding protein [Planosporangium flavigriseum]